MLVRVPVVSTLEDRIRDLCAKAVAADESQAEAILAELRTALHEHVRFARQMTAATLSREGRIPPPAKAAK